jgi:CTD kinase subunit gamma
MYFIEHFLEIALREGHVGYARMLQRDIIRVVDAVAPENGSGAANVKVVRKVWAGLPTYAAGFVIVMLTVSANRYCRVSRTRTFSKLRPSPRSTRC